MNPSKLISQDIARLAAAIERVAAAIESIVPAVTANTSAPKQAPGEEPGLVDYEGLIKSGIWAAGAAPDVRTLQRWVKARRIPYVALGPRMVRFDVGRVRRHIAEVMTVQPAGRRHPKSGNVLRPRRGGRHVPRAGAACVDSV